MITKQIIKRFEEKQKDNHIGFIRVTCDTSKIKVTVESGCRAEYFDNLDEAEEFYQTYVNFIRKVRKQL